MYTLVLILGIVHSEYTYMLTQIKYICMATSKSLQSLHQIRSLGMSFWIINFSHTTPCFYSVACLHQIH